MRISNRSSRPGLSMVINPTMFSITHEDDYGLATFKMFDETIDTRTKPMSLEIVFFVINRSVIDNDVPESTPIVCTSTVRINNVYKS